MGKEYVLTFDIIVSITISIVSIFIRESQVALKCLCSAGEVIQTKALQPRPQQISTCGGLNSNEFGCPRSPHHQRPRQRYFSRYNTCQPQDNFSIQLGSGRELVCFQLRCTGF